MLLALGWLVSSALQPLQAQREPHLTLALPPAAALAADGPLVRGVNMLAGREMQELLRSGFPAQLHYRAELWSRGGLLNDLEGRAEWDVIVRQDPLGNTFEVARIVAGQVTFLGRFATLADAEAAVAVPYRVPIKLPRRGKRYYYTVQLDVETLSLSDLDEVERWLRGELRPAVRGRRNPGTALTRGLRTLVVRVLGGENRHYELRSPTFVAR